MLVLWFLFEKLKDKVIGGKMKRKNTDKEGKNKRRKVSTKKFQGINNAKGKKTIYLLFLRYFVHLPYSKRKRSKT
jgi:hypothetical protein